MQLVAVQNPETSADERQQDFPSWRTVRVDRWRNDAWTRAEDRVAD